MAKRITKDELFRQAFDACKGTIELIDIYFLGFTNNAEDTLTKRIFGIDLDRPEENDEEVSSAAFRKTVVWENLDALYNYAVEGVLPKGEHPEDVVLCGVEALTLVSSENVGFSERSPAFDLVSAADGRFGLDDGKDIELTKLANLANIDERTVRNAISAGELYANGSKPVYIDNQSARSWLRNRRGYKPTQIPSKESTSFADVNTPAEFGAFLKSQYERLYPDTAKGSLMPMHSAIGVDTLASLEAGVFNLPIDACSVLADFYQIERQLFLCKVMEIFYGEELHSLRQLEAEEKGAAQ